MSDLAPRLEMPPPGGVAWLDVSAGTSDSWPGRVRMGPLGLQIARLPNTRAPYFFKGARLRGARCMWSASTLSGAELSRPTRQPPNGVEGGVHILVRADCAGSVFDPLGQLTRGTLKVFEPGQEIREQFSGNTHLFTLNVQRGTLGVEQNTLVGDARPVLRPHPVPGRSCCVRPSGCCSPARTSSARRPAWSASTATSARWPACCCARRCASGAPTSSRWSRSAAAPTRSSSSRRPIRC